MKIDIADKKKMKIDIPTPFFIIYIFFCLLRKKIHLKFVITESLSAQFSIQLWCVQLNGIFS